MQIEFMSQANSNYMVDADVVSCCLHALIFYLSQILLRDGGTRIAVQMQRQIKFLKIRISTIAVRMVDKILTLRVFWGVCLEIALRGENNLRTRSTTTRDRNLGDAISTGFFEVFSSGFSLSLQIFCAI